ncbi:MAG: ATP-binding protein, partial [Caldilineaceae bacterium]
MSLLADDFSTLPGSGHSTPNGRASNPDRRRATDGPESSAPGTLPLAGPQGRPVKPGSRTWQPPESPCAICGGAGFLMPDLPIGHPAFGKAIPCECRRQELLERRLRAVSSVGAQETVAHLTFERFMPEGQSLPADKAENLRRAFDMCRTFAQQPSGWLLITGPYGCGKTHLAAAIVNATIAGGQVALFLNAPDLLDHLRATFSPDSELTYDALFERLRNAPLLVLDDLGAQSSTSWAQEKLFQLLNHRYNVRLPTVITTNQRMDEVEPRLRSRIQDIDLVRRVVITAPDFRMGGAAGQFDLSTLALYGDKRFDTFDVNRPVASSAEKAQLFGVVESCREFARNPRGWLVLSGSNGCGKTHLAAAVANEQRDLGRTDVMMIAAPDLLDALRATFSPNSSNSYDRRFDEIRRVPMLVLDDLGTESATPWAREKLFQLLNFRYTAMLPTVITTSQELDKVDP